MEAPEWEAEQWDVAQQVAEGEVGGAEQPLQIRLPMRTSLAIRRRFPSHAPDGDGEAVANKLPRRQRKVPWRLRSSERPRSATFGLRKWQDMRFAMRAR